MTYIVSASMPQNGAPVPGVKFQIIEYKSKKGKLKETGWTRNDVTDLNGKARGRFMGKSNGNYSYYIYFDYSGMELPPEISDVSVSGPSYTRLSRYSEPESNYFDIRILPYTSYHFKVENVNCFDANDKMRFKVFNYDEKPYDDFQYHSWGNYFIGCGLHVDHTNEHVKGGHYAYQIEVTRNGVVTTEVDTFNLLPNTMNEVFIAY